MDSKNANPTAGDATLSSELKRRTREILYVGLILCGALILSALSLKFLPVPFVWIGLTWASALIGGLFLLHGAYPRWSLLCLHGAWLRALLFSVSVATASLAGVEAYFSLYGATVPKYSDKLYVTDDVLGTALAKGVRVHVISGTSFDVINTTDTNGVRIAPPVRSEEHAGCLLFFGCSFTFGSGLQDNETMPYQVGIQSGGKYPTFNFAVPGYGPNQMLAQIEYGRVGRVVDCNPKYAIYLALTDHARRVAGKAFSSMHGPRYVLDPDGTVRRDGNFAPEERTPSAFEAEVHWQLGKSATYRFFSNLKPAISDSDVRLMLATVRRSRDLLVAEYPGIQFHVILWTPWGHEDAVIYRELQDGFRQMNIPVHLVADILPDYNSAPSKYAISSTDRHPNALADHLLANYVLTKIVSAGSGGWNLSKMNGGTPADSLADPSKGVSRLLVQ